MPNTPKGLTYPSSSSPVADPADIQELATYVDGLIVPNTGGTYTGSVSFTNSPSVPTPTSGLHAVNKTYADAINTDVTAIETELGTNPSGTFSTVASRLDSYTTGFNNVGNLLTANQASAESGATTGWSSVNATLTASTDRAVDGTYSFKLVNTADATVWMGPDAGVANYVPVTAGETYTATADWYVPSTNTGTIGSGISGPLIYWYTAAGVYVSDTGGVLGPPPEDAWTTRKVTAVAPATAAYARLFSIYTSSSYLKANDVVYIDRVGLWKGASGRWAMPGVPIVGGSHIAVNNAVNLSGIGTPEGVVVAAPGSTYLQTDSVVDVKGWIRWIKSTGTGNTGWIAGPEADTGWRQIVSWSGGVQDGTNQVGTIDTTQYSLSGTGGIWIRRIGQYVEWWLHGAITKTNSGSHKLFTVDNRIPSGFRADGQATYGVSVPLSHTVDFLGTSGIGDTPSFDSTAGGFNLAWHSCRHYTSNSWPTSLPGTAA